MDYKTGIRYLRSALGVTVDPVLKMKVNTDLAIIYDKLDPDSADYYRSISLKISNDPAIDAKDRLLNEFKLRDVLNERYDIQDNHLYRKEILEEYRVLFPNDLTTHARMLKEISATYRRWEKYDSPLLYAQESLEILKGIYGTENLHFTTGLTALGEILGWQGDYDSAAWYYERSLEIKKEILGDAHPLLIEELSALGQFASTNRQNHKALDLLEKAYALAVRKYGEENKVAGDQLFILLQHYNRARDYKKSVALYPKLLKIDSLTYGLTSNYAISLSDYSNALKKVGKLEQALLIKKRSKEIVKQELGVTNYMYGMGQFGYGIILEEKGDIELAAQTLDSAVSTIQAGMAKNHPRIGSYQKHYAEFLYRRSNDSLANVYYTNAIDNYKINYLKKHPERLAEYQLLYAQHLVKEELKDSASSLLNHNLTILDSGDPLFIKSKNALDNL